MANKRKSGKRSKSGRLSREKFEVERRRKEEERMQIELDKPGSPNRRVLERRNLFAFVRPSKGPDGRHGTIDQDICDGIGQLHALDLFEGHGFDPQLMRDCGRLWGNHLASLLTNLGGAKVSSFVRLDRSNTVPTETIADIRFDRMDDALSQYERGVLYDLIVTPLVGLNPHDREVAPWAQSLIDEALMARGLFPREAVRFPDAHDRDLLKACIRGLCQLVDGALPSRLERKAA